MPHQSHWYARNFIAEDQAARAELQNALIPAWIGELVENERAIEHLRAIGRDENDPILLLLLDESKETRANIRIAETRLAGGSSTPTDELCAPAYSLDDPVEPSELDYFLFGEGKAEACFDAAHYSREAIQEKATLIAGLISGDESPYGIIEHDGFGSDEYGVFGCGIDLVLDAINAVMGGEGVEAVFASTDTRFEPKLRYINRGDPYEPTVCYYNGQFYVAGYGEIIDYDSTFNE